MPGQEQPQGHQPDVALGTSSSLVSTDVFATPRGQQSETIVEELHEGEDPESEVKQQETGAEEVKETKIEEEEGDEEKPGMVSPISSIPEVERGDPKTERSPLRNRLQVL